MKLLSALVVSSLVTSIAATAPPQQPLGSDGRPNIVFILTDDQDLHLDSLDYMPLLHKHVTSQGTFYRKHYCSTAVCCPSRVSLWTGKYAHNTNVTDVFPPYGGYPKFISQGLNEQWLPVWLQQAGYNTFYTGKLFNHHTVDNYDSPYPAGWTSSDFLLDPYTYQYLNATFQRNQDKPVSWEGHYSTDVLGQKAYGLLEEAISLQKPFFLVAAPNAPHSNVVTFNLGESDTSASVDGVGGLTAFMTAPIPAPRHKDLFPDAKVPRNANFNPDKHEGVSWLKDLPKLNDTVIEYNDLFYRRRLQALQAVDEIIEGLVERLSDAGILENTYIIFSTDNGYHISQHRLSPGKTCGFEEDINIPLIIRGPGVPKGEVTDVVTAHTDLVPTIFEIAGVSPHEDFDGSAIPLDENKITEAENTRQEHVNVEFWGKNADEGIYGISLDDDGKIVGFNYNNTYKGLRLVGHHYSLYYSVWCTNEHELYDLLRDPYQTKNLYPSVPQDAWPEYQILSRPFEKVISRLDALLFVTKSCKGVTCTEPWRALHENGQVQTLSDALDERFDGFYDDIQQKVSFDRCEEGYILDAEGPQFVPL